MVTSGAAFVIIVSILSSPNIHPVILVWVPPEPETRTWMKIAYLGERSQETEVREQGRRKPASGCVPEVASVGDNANTSCEACRIPTFVHLKDGGPTHLPTAATPIG